MAVPIEHHRDGFTVSTDPARLDVDAIHAFLTMAYWAEGIPRESWSGRSAARSASASTARSARSGWRG